MDRPRRRRRDPQRTGPIRNAGEAWREEPRRDDVASRGVREGYRVIEEQIRRGRRMAEALDDDDWNDGPARGARRPRRGPGPRTSYRGGSGGFRLLETQMRHISLLAQEILRQVGSARPDPWRLSELIFRLYFEALSELARFGFGLFGGFASPGRDRFREDVDRIDRDFEDSYADIEEDDEDDDEEDDFDDLDDEDEPGDSRDWPAGSSAPTVIRTQVPIPVYVSAHEQTEVDLDLPAGSHFLDLEIEPPPVSTADEPAEPAFEADVVALRDGPAVLRIAVPRDLPAGRYQRRVLVSATGEQVGTLTVQVGTVPKPATKTNPKARKR